MSTSLVGQVLLGQFRVDSFIAAGGMGAVYKVYDLKRNVYLAMKVLQPELLEDPVMLSRFQREADVLMTLAHPNIVPFYGLFQAGEVTFLVQRFIDGPTLQDYLRRYPNKAMPVSQILIFLRALSSALSYAHNNRVVHCDIKSANVMIDQGGTIYLADFGIARHAGSTTTNYGIAGTPAYMAPEQLLGQPVSPATDVYALGVLLFEMATGQRPFRGTDPASAQAGETVTDRLRFEHLRLVPPDPVAFHPELPPRVADVILKALEKNPSLRYGDVMHLFEDFCEACGVYPEAVADRVALEGMPKPAVQSTAQAAAQSTDAYSDPAQPGAYRPPQTAAAVPLPDLWDRPLRRQTIVIQPPREKPKTNRWLVGCLGLATLAGVVGIVTLVALLFFSPGVSNFIRNLFPIPATAVPVDEPTEIPEDLPTEVLPTVEQPPPTRRPDTPIPIRPSPTPVPTIQTRPPVTAVPTLTPPPLAPKIEDFTNGMSVKGVPLRWKRVGSGEKTLVVIGNIHGSERNTGNLVGRLSEQVDWWLETVGQEKRIFFLPQLNPDGVAANEYFNAHGVDLNRNWATSNWQSFSTGTYGWNVPGKGGSAPFSEPETNSTREFLLHLRSTSPTPLIVVSYHSATAPGVVQPSYTLTPSGQVNDRLSIILAKDIANWTGYQYIDKWTAYQITGEFIHWCGEQGITCVDIELPTHDMPTDAVVDRHKEMLSNILNTRWR